MKYIYEIWNMIGRYSKDQLNLNVQKFNDFKVTNRIFLVLDLCLGQ